MSTICSVEGCGRPGCKRTRNGRISQYGMCGGHRNRFYKYGDVMADVPIRAQEPRPGGWLNPGGYVLVARTGHPIAPKSGHVFAHRIVLFDAIGPGSHDCHWCGKSVSWHVEQRRGGLEVDHLDGDKTNNALSNLVPACTSCNSKRRNVGNPIEWAVSA